MTTPTPAGSSLDGLDATVQRELEAAREHVHVLADRRAKAEHAARAAAEAERTARRALASLEAVAREVAGLLPDASNDHHVGTRDADLPELAGAELRAMIARVALRYGAVGRAVHWSTWYGWLLDAGFRAAGKKPEATFQTQLARSPLVRRGDHVGAYVLNVEHFRDERARLRELHGQLSRMPPPDQLDLLGNHRERRRELQVEIARVERAVEEMWRVLSREHPSGWTMSADAEPEQLVEAWMSV